MNRRTFLYGTISTAVTAPLAGEAQPAGKVYRIGWLDAQPGPYGLFEAPFLRALSELGRVEGRHFVVEYRYAGGSDERLPSLAEELLGLNVDVIVSVTTPATIAAMKATRTIPIVFAAVADPTASGFVASLARPGGNVTGVSLILHDIAGKLFELLSELVPGISRVAILWGPASAPGTRVFEQAVTAARKLQMTAQPVEFQDDRARLESVFEAMAAGSAEGLVVLISPSMVFWRSSIAELALQHRLPVTSSWTYLTHEGGLASYAPDFQVVFHQAARLVDQILKGANSGDLPVEQPTRFELFINLKTARALGLTVPPSLLLRADQVVE